MSEVAAVQNSVSSWNFHIRCGPVTNLDEQDRRKGEADTQHSCI